MRPGRAPARGFSAALTTVLLLGTAACSAGGSSGAQDADTPSPSTVRTLTPLPPPPEPPPSGRLLADLRQSSRDAARGEMQVWIDNDTTRDVSPAAIVYADARLVRRVAAQRLRDIPAQAERGYPLPLPEPSCGRRGPVRLLVTLAGERRRVVVTDEADVVSRYVRGRCLELAVGRVARLAFDPDFTVTGQGPTAVARVDLVVTPTGRPGPVLVLESLTGTPILTSPGAGDWSPRAVVRGTDPPRRIRLPMTPTRCDAHAFQESGGATAFGTEVRVGDRRGRLTLRMDPESAAAAIGFAARACGLR